MFSDSTEIIEAGICGVKCRPPALTSAPVVTYRVRFSLPLLSKRIKTLTRNCDLLWSSMKKKGRKREGEKTTTRLGHVQEAERVCSPCVCASGRDRNSLKMVEIKADRHWDFHRYLHRGEKKPPLVALRCGFLSGTAGMIPVRLLHSNLYMWLLLSLFTCETDIKHTGWPAWGRRGRERKIEEKKRMQQSSLYTTSATGLLVIYRSLLFLYKNFFSSFFFWVVVNVGFTLSLVLLETQQPPVLTYCLPLYSMTVATTLFFFPTCYILPRLGHSLLSTSSPLSLSLFFLFFFQNINHK